MSEYPRSFKFGFKLVALLFLLPLPIYLWFLKVRPVSDHLLNDLSHPRYELYVKEKGKAITWWQDIPPSPQEVKEALLKYAHIQVEDSNIPVPKEVGSGGKLLDGAFVVLASAFFLALYFPLIKALINLSKHYRKPPGDDSQDMPRAEAGKEK